MQNQNSQQHAPVESVNPAINMTEEVANAIENETEKAVDTEIATDPSAEDAPPRMTLAEDVTADPPPVDPPKPKRKYTRRAKAAGPAKQSRRSRNERKGGRSSGRKAKAAKATPALVEKVRQRRPKLSAAVRKIEHNVLRHVTREVRHTGVGWNPPVLDPAWDGAIKRLANDGIVEKREDMGGYVPTTLVGKLASINSQVLAYVKQRFKQTGKGVSADRLVRARAQALARLERSGKIARTEEGFLPVEGLEAEG